MFSIFYFSFSKAASFFPYIKAQLTRTVDGVFYATMVSSFQTSNQFDTSLLDTSSASFRAFAANVEPNVCINM